MHEKLEKKRTNAFEMVIAQEIGHLWLYNVVGFNNLSTNYFNGQSKSKYKQDIQ